MQQQEAENNSDLVKPALSTQKAIEHLSQEQQQNQPNVMRKLQIAIPFAIQLVKLISRAAKQDATALQIEDALVQSLICQVNCRV